MVSPTLAHSSFLPYTILLPSSQLFSVLLVDTMDIDGRTNRDRAFIQGILARGSLTFDEAKPMIAAIFAADDPEAPRLRPEDISKDQFLSFINTAAGSLAAFDLRLRKHEHQLTKKIVYAVTNISSDPVTQLATTLAADEISFVKRLLDAMFDTNNTPRLELMAIAGTPAVNLRKPPRKINSNDPDEENGQQSQRNPDKGLSIDEAETVLHNMMEGGWLERTPKKYLTLAPRGLMELRRWLVETYNDPDAEEDEWQRIKFCVACKEIVTMGQRCADRDCNARIHDTCSDSFFRSMLGQSKCPKCGVSWDGTHYVGDRATGRDRETRRNGAAGPSHSKGRRSGRTIQASQDDETTHIPEDDTTNDDS